MDVLLAEDDEDIRFMVAALLGRRGWTVTTTVNGQQALDVLASEHFDVMVLDQNMPPVSGIEVAQHRRAVGDLTPIVLFTAFVPTIDRDAAAENQVVVMDKTEVFQLPSVLLDLASAS